MKHTLEAVRKSDLWSFCRWTALSAAVGLGVGAVGVVFHRCLELCQELRLAHPWLLWLLPLGGAAIALLYRLAGREGDRGTDMVLVAVRDNLPVPGVTAPLIFLSTALTHLLGGSAGREGAALQLGGSIASALARPLRLDEKDSRVLVMCGASACFAALFGTPVTAAVFSLEVVSVGVMYYSAAVPCGVAALCAAQLALFAGASPTAFQAAMAPARPLPLLGAGALAVLCAGVSVLFCFAMHRVRDLLRRFFPDPCLRGAAGGVLLILLTLLSGTRDYNGAGMEVISRAVAGDGRWQDFLWKMLFTAVTLGAGFKGGEIVPSFFVGAAFGCAAGPLLGLEPGMAAALGLLAVFCGVTNCPTTSVLLGVELFGGEGLLYYGLACAVSYMLSGYGGLYGEQHILYSKARAEYIGGGRK